MGDAQVTRLPKLTRNGNFRAWAVQMRAALTTADGLDRFLSEEPDPDDEGEVSLDKQARAKLIMCLGIDMLSLVEETHTAHAAFEALRADHLGHAVSMRSALLSEVTAMRQTVKQSVKDYIAVGRDYMLRLRDAGVESPATLLIPCFKAGIDNKLKQSVLPLLNQSEFDSDFEALSQEFQRITVGMQYLGAGGQANAATGSSPRPAKPKKQWVENRKCFVCGKSGHIAKKCPDRKKVPPAEGGGEPPVVLFSQGESRNRANSDTSILLFDSGATHHILYDERYLRNVRTSSITKIELGGGECHYVMGEGELLLRSPDTGRTVLLTSVLWVPSLTRNLCSGAQLTLKGHDVVCTQRASTVTITMDGNTLLDRSLLWTRVYSGPESTLLDRSHPITSFVGTYNRLILTTGHLSAQMSSGQDKAVICSNKNKESFHDLYSSRQQRSAQ
jgi:hypothetical protein